MVAGTVETPQKGLGSRPIYYELNDVAFKINENGTLKKSTHWKNTLTN